MGEKSVKLLRNRGVYLVYTGGAGALAADHIRKVVDVAWYDELGMTDAVWVFEVEDFGPLIVGIDAHGKTLFKNQR
jgi:tartrate dehydratase beta subunit/fumarate hydratase class I family protein